MQQFGSMIAVPWADVVERAKGRPPGYIQEVRSMASIADDKMVVLSVESWAALRAKYAPLEPVSLPFTIPQPPGLGTRLARLFKRLGFQQKPGCGCAKRQRWLDDKVPLRWLK